MTESAAKPTKTSAEIVLEAVQDLYAREQLVTRETLAELTGLKFTTIDDRLAYLVDNGRIRRVQRGVFVPAEQHKPARPISRTLCPDGTTVLEVGDTVMILSPRESRMIGELMAGSSQQYAAIEIGLSFGHAECFAGAGGGDAIDPLAAMHDADREGAIFGRHAVDSDNLACHLADRGTAR